MKGLNTCLWLESNAEEAMNTYLEIFPDAKFVDKTLGSANMHLPEGAFLAGVIEIAGHEIMLLNGGPHYKLTPAASITIKCEDQEEIDHYWSKLGEGGQEMACGWVEDRFGVSWQVVPANVSEFLKDPDQERVGRYWAALMEMVKIDMAALEKAREG